MGVHKFSRVFLVLCFLSIAHSFDLCHGFQALCSLALVPTRPNFLGNEILTLHQFNATLNQILIKGECAWKQHFQFFFTFSEFIKFLDKLNIFSYIFKWMKSLSTQKSNTHPEH